MVRKIPHSPSISRRRASIEPNKKIVVICEGEVTEPNYLNTFSKYFKNPLVVVEVMPKGGPIRSLVSKAKARKDQLVRESRYSRDSFDKNFQVWGMADVDAHPKLSEALAVANDVGIKMALSNPCFEIWGVFHFELQDGGIDRHAAQRRLEKLMPGYLHSGNAVFDAEVISTHYETALQNATLALRRREEEGTPRGNPSTNVHELLEIIRKPR